MSNAALELSSVTMGYDRRKVVNDISFKVQEGSVVGIIGPNGHGKSSLLRSISGLEPLWSGQIFLDGRAIHDLPAHQRVSKGIVQIPQGDLIFPI